MTDVPNTPYRGLASFGDTELDSQLFFGREREIEIGVANLEAARLTVLYGASGVGKTSLLRAGVVYSLRRRAEEGERHVVAFHSEWQGDPLEGVSAAIADAAGIPADATAEATVPVSLADQLEVLTERLDGEVYLILDQIEEYLLYHGTEAGGPLADALAEIVARPNLRVGMLLGIRDDALAQLDSLKARVPGLFGNLLRLEHLSRTEGREAIVAPLVAFSAAGGPIVNAESQLVENVLDQVAAGAITVSEGRGLPLDRVDGGRIEAPFLQLVMERIWSVERARGSSTLRASTLEGLGGARQIVEEHLERALRALETTDQDRAAAIFGFLVTPSGTKIAHRSEDLARYTGQDVKELDSMLEHLSSLRVIRPVAGVRGDERRYEIYHDVLADAVLAWSIRHEGERELRRAEERARRRHRRVSIVALVAVLGLAAMTALTVWALSQRNAAQQATAEADAARAVADSQAKVALAAQEQASKQATEAEAARKEAERQAEKAQAAQDDAEEQAAAATTAKEEATHQAELAESERQRADQQTAAAEAAKAEAETAAATAKAAQATSEQQATQAQLAKADAQHQAQVAKANESAARALVLLTTKPEASLASSLQALDLLPTAPVEGALRAGLIASRVTDILAGGGGDVIGSFAGVVGATPPSRFAASVGASPRAGIVTVTDLGVVRVFDRASGTLIRSFVAHPKVTSASPSPDGRLLAVGDSTGFVTIYTISTGRIVGSVRHIGSVTSVAFSPDGRLLASGGVNETAKLWTVDPLAPVARLEHPRSVRKVEFSRDGAFLLTVANDSVARLFDVRTGKLVRAFDHGTTLTSAALSPTGRQLVTTGQDATPRLWSVVGDDERRLRGHTGTVLTAAFSSNGESLVTTATDGTGRVWKTSTGELQTVLVGHTNYATIASFSPSGARVLTAGRDGSARVWNAVTGAVQAVLLGHGGRVLHATFDRGEAGALTSGDDGTARTWALRLEDPVSRSLGTGSSAVTDLAASTRGAIADAHADGVVNLRDAGGRVRLTVRHGDAASSVALAEGGDVFATGGSDGLARVWSLRTGKLLRTVDHGAPVSNVLFGRGDQLITAGDDGDLRSWARVGSRSTLIAHERAPIADLALDPASSHFAIAVGDIVRLRESSGVRIRDLVGHRDEVTSVAFSPDGREVVSASKDHDVLLWDVPTGRIAHVFQGHAAIVRDAAFSPDGRWIASAGPTRTGIWEVSSQSTLPVNRLAFVAGHEGGVSAVAFIGDGWQVVTGGIDGAVRTYRCVLCGTSKTLAKIAKAKLDHLARDRAA